jgi:HTH-type transcriptional regulator / antitoxin HigA
MADFARRLDTDYSIPPGETLAEILQERGMSQADLARRTARPLKTINEIIKGKAAITPGTAIQLERVLAIPSSFWNNLEANYREDEARLDERRELAGHVRWLNEFPIKEMLRYRLITEPRDKVGQLRELLNFFGVSSPQAWQRQLAVSEAQFRQSTAFRVSESSLSVWLRWGELEARRLECEPFSADRFRQALVRIRLLTRDGPEVFVPAVRESCAKAGVAVLFIPELPRTRISGATWWLTPDKAVIQLSLRYKRDDTLWFSFFHEAGHILLQGRRRGQLHNDQWKGSATPREEAEANRFARDFLIPPDAYELISHTHADNPEVIKRFANRLGIAPGIVVGRLQYDKLLSWGSACNELRRPLRWAEEAQSD